MDFVSLGMRIKRIRIEEKKTQDELADMINSSRAYVAQIEAGTKIPSLEMVVTIANTLGVSADQLLVDSLSNSGAVKDSELEYMMFSGSIKNVLI